MAAVEDWNRQQVEQAQVQADHGHEENQVERTALGCPARGAGDADDALQFADFYFAGEKSAEDRGDLLDADRGLQASELGRWQKSLALKVFFDFRRHAHLPDGVAVTAHGLHWGDLDGNCLFATLDGEMNWFAVGAADAIDELAPRDDGRPIH